jgi:hypothetical protein
MLAVVLAASPLSMGCGEDAAELPPCTQLDGVCVGVPPGALCEGDFCTDGAACSAVIEVPDDAALPSAVASAQSGSCIALAPGYYSAVTLPAGVSLLGRGAADVHVTGVIVDGGSGTVIRGLEVHVSGIELRGTTDARIDAVAVRAGTNAIDVGEGASVTVVRSDVGGATFHGIWAIDSAAVTVTESVLAGSQGPGIWAQCSDGCACASKPVVTMSQVLVSGNKYVGVGLVSVSASLERVRIADTLHRDYALGGGLFVGACADVSADGLHVDKAERFGIFVDDASASFGQSADELGIVVVDSKPGVWLQRIGTSDPTQSVTVANTEVQGCRGVGMGFDLSARGIVVVDSLVGSTATAVLPLENGGQGDVGIGIVWNGGAAAVLQNVGVSGSSRQSIVIDGPVGEGSGLGNITLGGGDEVLGIVQQNVAMQDPAPDTSGSTPALARDPGEVAEIPEPLVAPLGID